MYFRELRNIQKAWKTRNIQKARNIQKTRKNRKNRKNRKARKNPENPEYPENPENPENPSVHPWGIEPQPKEPESFILSIKLWVHYRPLSP